MNGHGISPEIVELLKESLGERDGALLRIPFLGRKTPVASSADKLRTSLLDTGLEKFLVERYREEVAKLLYLAARSLLAREPVERSLTHWPGSAPDTTTCRRRFKRVSERVQGTSSEVELLESFYRGRSGPPSAYVLGRASNALRPSPTTGVFVAISLRHEGRHAEARRVLKDVLGSPTSAQESFLAQGTLGAVLYDTQDVAGAHQAYKAACSSGEASPLAFFDWFTTSLLLGDDAEAVRAASALEHSSAEDGVEIQRCMAGLSHALSVGRWQLNRNGRRIIKDHGRRLPPTATEIIHVITSSE